MRLEISKNMGVMLFAFLITFSVTACMKQPEPQAPKVAAAPPPPAVVEHVVKFSGETLGIIAQWYTGRTANWEVIAKANPSLNPNRIMLGDVIKIPADMVTRKEVMPKSAVGVQAKVEKPLKEDEAVSPDAPAEEGGAVTEEAIQEETTPAAQVEPTPDLSPQQEDILKELLDEQEKAPKPENQDAEVVAPAAPVVPEGTEALPSQPTEQKSESDAERDRLLNELLAN